MGIFVKKGPDFLNYKFMKMELDTSLLYGHFSIIMT